jgi:hypothetical protein
MRRRDTDDFGELMKVELARVGFAVYLPPRLHSDDWRHSFALAKSQPMPSVGTSFSLATATG